ncbi:MAG: acyl-ACP--UDP-N-acetylglucosamine O-acyltransferase [Bacteroidales bacterium]|nr:acyl-ACP--UDP-N-acetylglucosamine O-acyltransferase [Candidatus Cacconaster merdequi]
MMENIYIHPDARIGKNVEIGPFSYIDGDVEIGDNTSIGPNVTILKHVKIGRNCRIFPGAVIGAEPQDLKFKGEVTYVEIGDNTTIRECATVNRGTGASGKFLTKVGNNCLIMSYVHIAHDCLIGDNCIISSYAGFAGEATLDEYVVVGGGTLCHQFTHIGAHAMVGGALAVNKDIPPYSLVGRSPIKFDGVNVVGLRRRGFSAEDIESIHSIYRVIYESGLNVSDACEKVRESLPDSVYKDIILSFISSSERGIVK